MSGRGPKDVRKLTELGFGGALGTKQEFKLYWKALKKPN